MNLGVAFSIFFICHVYILIKERGRVLTSPVFLFVAYSFATNIAYYFMVATKMYQLPDWLYFELNGHNDQSIWIYFSLSYCLFLFSFYLPYIFAKSPEAQAVRFRRNLSGAEIIKLKKVFFLLGTFGVIVAIYRLNLAGGLGGSIFSNGGLVDRTAPLAGLGYISALSGTALNISAAVGILLIGFTKKKRYVVLGVLFFIFTVLANSSFGGRKDSLILVAVVVILWNLYIRKVSIFNPFMIAVYSLCAVYFTFVLFVRITLEGSVDSENSLILSSIANLSYIDTYIFIYSYFSDGALLYGRTFVDLLYAPMPSTFMPNKPPMDEGLYVRAFSLGINVPLNSPSSFYRGMAAFPPQTFGNMFMNFGYFGLVLGGFVLGCFLKKLHQYCLAKGTVFYLYLLFTSIFNFHLSNLRITTFLIGLVIIIVFDRVLKTTRKNV